MRALAPRDQPRHQRYRRRRAVTGLALAAATLTAGAAMRATSTTSSAPAAARTTPSSVSATGAPPSASTARAMFAGMSEAQRIGQLFMVGDTASRVDPATLQAIGTYHVGNVLLTGRSSAGTAATRSVTSALQARATAAATFGVPLFVGADQEGGAVQVLSGSGFATMPSALTQGGLPTATLEADARAWGGQLQAAGVNVNLAPVMGTVPAGENNPPIGNFHREYGHAPAQVSASGTAFTRGMLKAGVATTAKHFPGLGRVPANTDTSAGVTDTVTTSSDPYLAPFAAAIGAGTPMVMMSTADYARIDPGTPAAFSSRIIGGMLRQQLGFKGVVVSDDLGSARQVAAWSPGARAVDFLRAGGDIVLTVTPSVIPAMVSAVTAEAQRDAGFRAKVDAAALLVLAAKEQVGLLSGTRLLGDFNGDGHADLAVFRPSNGTWYIHGRPPVHYGTAGDIPVPADYNGDGRTELAVYRPSNGTWYIRGSGLTHTHYGTAGDMPVPGDYTGDGHANLALFRPSTGTWYVLGSGLTHTHYGNASDIPVPADYNGDGRTDLAVFRPSNGTWYVHVRGAVPTHYGIAGDVPVPADYTGDGHANLALFRPSNGTWYIQGSGLSHTHYGNASDTPVPADYNGDGRADLAVFRPSNGTWYVHVRGAVPARVGAAQDVPV